MPDKNAEDYIIESSIYTSERYTWFKPIIDATIGESLDDDLISELVDSIYLIEDQTQSQELTDVTESEDEELEAITIKWISSVDHINNIGLVDFTEPIKFNDGLNIIYGKNASGKSSIYAALCNVLGENKPTLPNLNKDTTEMSAAAHTILSDDTHRELSFPFDGNNDISGIRIFDSDICTYLVERDQINEFELAHLKSELFPLLSNAYDKLKNRLEKCKAILDDSYLQALDVIQDKIPELNEKSEYFSKDKIEGIKISDKNQKRQAKLSSESKTLKGKNLESTLKNILAAIRECKSILNRLGDLSEIENDTGETKFEWNYQLDNLIAYISTAIKKHEELKSIVDSEGKAKLGNHLPSEWFDNEHWERFIKESILFIDTLEETQQEIYRKENCPYCLQDLVTDKSHDIIDAYHTLQNETKKNLEENEESLEKYSESISTLQGHLDDFPDQLSVINSELDSIGNGDIIKFDSRKLSVCLDKILDNIQNYDDKKVDLSPVADLKIFGQTIYEKAGKFQKLLGRISGSVEERGSRITAIEKELDPLNFNQSIIENKDPILSCINQKAIIDTIDKKLADLTAIKQATSLLSTRFSREVPLDIFRQHLEKEYEFLGYSIPEIWSIKSQTDGPINKRVYSMRDKRISDIFSEGERKVHALADFFSEAELNEFSGVYIFDDPVNSLDENNIELVADRIIKCVDDGNQVLVFTHSLVFLYCLIEKSKQRISIVERISDQIYIEDEIILGDKNELSKRLKEIDKRIRKLEQDQDLQKDVFYLKNIYDLISGYLESYVEIVLFNNVISRFRPNIRMNSLSKLTAIDSDDITRMIELYEETSRKGSRHSQPIGSPDPNFPDLLKHYELFKTHFTL